MLGLSYSQVHKMKNAFMWLYKDIFKVKCFDFFLKATAVLPIIYVESISLWFQSLLTKWKNNSIIAQTSLSLHSCHQIHRVVFLPWSSHKGPSKVLLWTQGSTSASTMSSWRLSQRPRWEWTIHGYTNVWFCFSHLGRSVSTRQTQPAFKWARQTEEEAL